MKRSFSVGLQLTATCALCVVFAGGLTAIAQQSGNVALWVEREVVIDYEGIALHGILTLPASE